jgi:DNA-directed RNA polymerase subunit RPC12/RpoP
MTSLSIITCPYCGHAAAEEMPPNACQIIYDCKECGARLKPSPGDETKPNLTCPGLFTAAGSGGRAWREATPEISVCWGWEDSNF